MGRAIELNESNFKSRVLESKIPVVVDFWAEWCKPCKKAASVLNQLAEELDGKVVFAKLNVEKNSKTVSRLGVRSIPTTIIFCGGKERERLVGAVAKEQIFRKIKPFLKQ